MATALAEEYMTLAEGVGIVPERFRNKGYDKLDFDAGEGGIHMPTEPTAKTVVAAAPDTSQMTAFLAGVAAGAEPAEMAKQLLGNDEPAAQPAPSRRAQKGGASS